MSQEQKPDADPPRKPPPAPIVHSFQALAEGRGEVLIEFNGQQYRLRTTRNGGLILNK